MITGNEPAHPFESATQKNLCSGHLTGLQYYAVLAMQGLLANNIYHNPNEKHNMITVPNLVATAVSYADALILELNKNLDEQAGGTISRFPSMPSEIVEIKSIGDEFIGWAEKYWQFKEMVQIDHPDSFAGEVCDYKYIRKVFVGKINDLIKQKLGV